MTHARIVLAAVAVYSVLAIAGGRVEVDTGLGPDRAAYAAMVAEHDITRGSAATRLSPMFPLAAVVPFALTGNVVVSFLLVNVVAVALLVFAACLILDRAGASTAVKACAAVSLILCGVSMMGLFVPAQPDLLAVSLITLAVAVAERAHFVVRSGAHVAAVLSGPLGVIAPLYGMARNRAAGARGARALGAFVPALAAWAMVQWWARGGFPGLIDAATPARVWSDADLWGEPAYAAFAAYLVVTSLGGLTVLLWSRPDALARAIRESPASLVLALPAALYVTTAGLDVARAVALLTPFWILMLGSWAASESGSRAWPLAGALLLTFATQWPTSPMDLTNYLVSWYPFTVYSGRSPIVRPELWDEWTPRFFAVLVGGWLLAGFRRADFVERLGERASRAGLALRLAVASRVGAVTTSATARWQSFVRGVPASIAVTGDIRWIRASYAWAAVAGIVMGIFLLGIPVQLSDCFALILQVHDRSLRDVVATEFAGDGYLRPFLLGFVKIVDSLAGGNYYSWFRGLHALQVIALLALVVRMLRVRRITQAAVVPLAVAVLAGLHTFAGTIREAFPINTFLTILLCCVAAVNLSQAAPRRAVDLAAAALLLFAMLTVESGLLVWVLCVTGYLVGYRGVSRAGIAGLTVLVAAYFFVRFAVLDVGTPGLTERGTGFGFSGYDPDELVQMFGGNPLPFYLYNVVSAMCSVLFAEPRGGTWIFTREALAGSLRAWHVLNVAACTVTTAIIVRYVVARLARWRRGELDDGDRIVALFCVILPANAAFAFAYAKDVIMSPAGVFYAAAAYVAVGALVAGDASVRLSPVRRTATCLLVAFVATAWGLKLVGVHYSLRRTAPSIRNEWAYYHEWEERQRIYIRTPKERRLWQTLYDDAIWRTPAPPEVVLRWADELFDLTQ